MTVAEGLHFDCRLGEDIAPVLPEIAALRRLLFRQWPILWTDDGGAEHDDLSAAFGSPRAIAVLVWRGARLVGAAAGLPMADEVTDLRRPLAAGGIDPRAAFFLDQAALLPECRVQGVGRRLFAEREDHARGLGYRWAVLAAIERSPADPRQPPGWVPLDGLWRRLGYRPTAILAHLAWKEAGEGVATAKPLRLWRKELVAASPGPA